MEPPRKRQRISSPVDLGVLDPEDDFLKARTQNDFRLKSTFESIFEKYSKDFSTVGDVIDLETGEIVVNNGHLRKMRDEQDAGKLLNMLMAAPGDYDDLGDYDAEEIERKAILAIPELEEFFADSHSRADAGGNRAAISGNPSSPLDPGLEETLRKEASLDGQSSSASQRALPSSADILQQFGTNLGPRIIQYVAQLQAGSTSDVEPLWRTPALSHAPPAKEDTIKTVQKPLPGDRAASPTCRSIWGSKGTKAQLKKQACSVAEPAQKNGQKSVGVVLNKDRHSAPFKPLQNGVLSYSPNTRRKLKGGPIPTTADSRAKPDGNPVVLPEGEESLRDEQPEDIVRQNEAAIDEIPVSNIKLRRSARLRSAPDVIRDVQYSKSPMKIASVATGQQSRPPEKKVLSQDGSEGTFPPKDGNDHGTPHKQRPVSATICTPSRKCTPAILKKQSTSVSSLLRPRSCQKEVSTSPSRTRSTRLSKMGRSSSSTVITDGGNRIGTPVASLAQSSPETPTFSTPNGTHRKCGEMGFRCSKDFCMKCM